MTELDRFAQRFAANVAAGQSHDDAAESARPTLHGWDREAVVHHCARRGLAGREADVADVAAQLLMPRIQELEADLADVTRGRDDELNAIRATCGARPGVSAAGAVRALAEDRDGCARERDLERIIRIAAGRARDEARADVEALREYVEEWRDASGLVGVDANGVEGDPGDIEPPHVERFINRLERERDEARADVCALRADRDKALERLADEVVRRRRVEADLIEALGMLRDLVDDIGRDGCPVDLDRLKELALAAGLRCPDCDGEGEVDLGDPARRDPAIERVAGCLTCEGAGWRP